MKTFHFPFLFLALMFVGFAAQAQLQLGLGAAAGRNFSQIDYELANSTNYEAIPGLSGQWSLEVAYLLNDHWRISMGASAVLLDIGARRESMPFFIVSDEVFAFHFPVEAQYRLPTGKKHYLVFRGGASLATSASTSGGGARSASTFPNGAGEDATMAYTFEYSQPIAGYLRLGFGQEWILKGRRNSSIQLSVLYVQGFSNLFEGSIDYWDVLPPDGVSLRDAIETGLMPDPVETYPSLSSRGSYLCAELKLYVGMVRQ